MTRWRMTLWRMTRWRMTLWRMTRWRMSLWRMTLWRMTLWCMMLGWSWWLFFLRGQSRSTNQWSGMILEVQNRRFSARACVKRASACAQCSKVLIFKNFRGLKRCYFLWEVNPQNVHKFSLTNDSTGKEKYLKVWTYFLFLNNLFEWSPLFPEF